MRNDQRRAWVEVDLSALSHNAAFIMARARTPLLPMVKADAYGLGVGPVVQALEALDPWGYGVATVEEGAELRSLGITRPVLVFTPLLPDEFEAVRYHQLTPTLGDEARVQAWHSSGGGEWHLAIDTGMNRAGVPWERVGDLSWVVSSAPPEGAFTHFHSAELEDGTMEEQLERFDRALSQLPSRPKYLHAENSPALERRAPSRWDLARPGVSLYGVGSSLTITDPASGHEQKWSWRPVASLHARVVEIRDVAEGETVSYGGTWTAQGTRRVATASAGYADGVRRHLGNRSVALVNGMRAPIAGVVTMDMTMLDVTGIACQVGDVATFVGRQGDHVLPIMEVAAAGDLSPYELLVGLQLRAPRVYVYPAS
jgi:alanine racemase